MSCIRTSQAMAVRPILAAEAPAFAHGETAERPIPVPKASSASDKAAATKAPATTAPQDTPDECASFLTDVSATPICERAADDEGVDCSTRLPSFYSRSSRVDP